MGLAANALANAVTALLDDEVTEIVVDQASNADEVTNAAEAANTAEGTALLFIFI